MDTRSAVSRRRSRRCASTAQMSGQVNGGRTERTSSNVVRVARTRVCASSGPRPKVQVHLRRRSRLNG
eukprot:8359819-Pyramimonas_sp.AAC.1